MSGALRAAGRRWPWYVAGAALLVLALAALAVTRLGDDGSRAIQLVVSPHPDDEVQGWARISRGEGLYTVFMVMTGGESTGNCDGAPNLQEEWGERAPDPMPGPAGRGTDLCAAARIDSWHAFLDATSDMLPGGDRREDMQQVDAAALGAVEVWIGDNTARVAMDAGDTDVTGQEVEEAVRGLLDRRGEELPDLPLHRVVATAYSNDAPTAGENREPECPVSRPCKGDPRDLEYEHPDHVAVNHGVALLAGLGRDGAWLVTPPHDGKADERMALSRTAYAELMGLGERLGSERDSFERTGAHQVAYGWLAFPGSYWPAGGTASARNDVLFPRVQFYRHVEGTG
jgi:hypothetical protein